ncbi:hypothetical protein DPMN_118727 [Dreissena polymorpha]|uniref:Endonuclease/exonuclease/phosphatase domain-containing protein n=1 Tax=Dreissena polymorpha TaxID=45954 RepID=A0A9D4GHY5_DREPO|nr:hypothetical protein DPMN_118727 [Dreissena polymorpha]
MTNSHCILLQETSLFKCRLSLLGDIGNGIFYAEKTADQDNPLLPIQLPRGHGGVVVLWKKSIDQLVTQVSDGNEIIQCVEVNSEPKVLIISAYMPFRDQRNKKKAKKAELELQEFTNQLREIVLKYKNSHSIMIGGDMNTDLSIQRPRLPRTEHLLELITDLNLKFNISGKNYVDPKGRDCSEIYYFLIKHISHQDQTGPLKKEILKHLESTTSDYYPIKLNISVNFSRKIQKEKLHSKLKRLDGTKF